MEDNLNAKLRQAVLIYYQSTLKVSKLTDSRDLVFLDYDKLAQAVLSMKVKQDELVCPSKGAATLYRMYEAERESMRPYVALTRDTSAVVKVTKALVKSLNLKLANGKVAALKDARGLFEEPKSFFSLRGGRTRRVGHP
jgi:hypothetical protein